MLQPKDTDWLNGYKNKTHTYAVYRDPLQIQVHKQTESEGMEETFHANRKQKKARVAVLTSDRIQTLK